MPYDNNMRGVLFKNDEKKNPKHPDYRGSCEIDGTEFWLSGWVKESKKGNKFLSLSFKPKEEAQHDQRRQDDDDIPF
jgi:uncharacterized protein (DUF736 family)